MTQLRGQTIIVIGGSAGIGLETARRARAEGADVILTGRNPERLETAATELGASSTASFDANDSAALEGFFAGLDGPIDHVMVTAGGPYYAPLAEMDFDEARRALQEHPMLMARRRPLRRRQGAPGRHAAVHGRHRRRAARRGVGISSAMTAALPALDGEPGARDRAGASQPDRRRLRGHAVVGVAARRPARRSGVTSCGTRCRSDASSGRTTSPLWRCTS